ncbi:MAG: hypothetical protein E6K79_09650 [Candidatus Eisenbacteria bacterium]|uniref:FlgD/Vpr Ig-like domain-containing protein n=1 Tax=Eiseniibacteriota bacterium TaxID=2212470 RepID=A0A538TJU0_UNCEI|nr:MAG: hypothetical protein E6K79_09650 [Candidatus Eisenbacteria bacterium]
MQALSMAMQSTIPPYPSVEITARMKAASGATIRSSKCTREPYATRFAADKRKDFRLEGFRVRVIASRRMTSSSVRRSRPLRHALLAGCLLAATAPAADALPEVVATRGLPSSISSTYGTAVPLGDPSTAGLFAISTRWGVEIRDAVSGAEAPVGAFRTSGAVNAVAADGNTLYLFAGTRGIVAVDVTDPANPAAIGSRGDLGDLKLGAASPNGYGLAAANASELHFLGRSSPGALSLLATLRYADDRIVRAIVARSDSFLVVSERSTPLQRLFLTLYRLPAGAAQPQFVSEIPVPNQAPTGMVWRGDLAFIGAGSLGILTANVRTGVVTGPAGIGKYVREVDANDSVVVAAAQAGTFVRLRRSGSGGATLINPTFESLPLEPIHIALSGSRVAISVQDVDSAQDPDEVGRGAIEFRDLDLTLAIPAVGGTGRTRRVAWSAGLAYVADYTGGLRIYRADGSDTSLVGVLPLGSSTRVVDIALDPPRHRAYLAAGSQGLQIVDTTDPSAPALLSALPLPGLASAVAVVDSDLVVVGRRGTVGAGLTFVDVTSPASPAPRGQLGSGSIPDPRAIAVKDTIAFVADESLGLLAVRFGNPDAPGLVGTPTGTAARDLDLSGNVLLVATGAAGLQVVNVSNPVIPVLQSQVATPALLGVARSANSAALFLGDEGALVVDLNNPSAPVLRGPIGVPGASRDGIWVGDTLLVATGFALERFRVSPAPTVVPALTIEFDRALLLPRARIRWTPVSLPGMVGLNVYRDLLPGRQGTSPAGTLVNKSLLSPGATEAVDDSLVAGTTCRYRLEAFFADGSAIKVAEGSIFVPSNSAVGRPFPNPYRPNGGAALTLPFRIAPGSPAGTVEVTIHDASGRLVRRSVQAVGAGGGFGTAAWDGRDGRGRKAPDGVYFARVRGPGIDDARQFVLLH